MMHLNKLIVTVMIKYTRLRTLKGIKSYSPTKLNFQNIQCGYQRGIILLNRVIALRYSLAATFESYSFLPRIMRKAILSFFVLWSFGLFAQTTVKWTLQECIDYALEHNVSIQQNELRGEILENNLSQSRLSRIPSLNGSGSHNYNIGRTIDPFTNTFNNTTIQNNSFSLSSGVLLYGGSQVNNTIKQNSVAIDANDKNTEVIRNQIALSIASTYLQIIQAEENLRVAESQMEITQDQLNRTKKLLKSGTINQSTALNLEAQIANDRVNVVNAQNAIQIGYNTLMNTMQYPLDQPIEVERISILNLPEMPSETVAQLYETALANLPEIAQAELQIEQNLYGEKVAKGGMQPSLRAFGNVNTVYSESGKEVTVTEDLETYPVGITQNTLEPVISARPITVVNDKAFGNQISDNLGQQVGLSLSIPIFNGLSSRTSVENAKVNTQISELNLINTKAQLRNDVTTAYTNLKVAKSRFGAATLSLQAQQINFEFSQKRFDAGMLNSTELLTAKNQWNQTQIQALNAKYEYVFRKLIIDFYKGQKLEL